MPLDPQLQRSIIARFAYFRDLGVFEFYRRDGGATREMDGTVAGLNLVGLLSEDCAAETPAARRMSAAPASVTPGCVTPGSVTAEPATLAAAVSSTEELAIPPPNPFPLQAPLGSLIAAEDRAEALRAIQNDIGNCTRCALSGGRNKIVFGDGNPNARLFFVGEGPGADEDAQGLPFVGRAGQLLNNMITAMGLKREQVYIANIVKCRPPQNRVPDPEEAHTCSPFLFRQIDVIRPEVLVALGATAALYLLGVKSSLSSLRGRVHQCRGAKLIVTYHPAYLLRDPRQKKEAWQDLQLAMAELGLSAPVS